MPVMPRGARRHWFRRGHRCSPRRNRMGAPKLTNIWRSPVFQDGLPASFDRRTPSTIIVGRPVGLAPTRQPALPRANHAVWNGCGVGQQ